MFSIKYLTMHRVQKHTGANETFLYGLSDCTGANPLLKTRGLSSRTDAQTIQYHTCIS